MRDLIERLLREAVKEQIERLFTYRNLQAVRDKFVQSIDAAVTKTETPYDDLVWRITRRLLDDDNLAELYTWVINTFGVFSPETICKAQPYDFASLEDKLELTEPNTAAAIPWADVVTILRVILPILMEWYNK